MMVTLAPPALPKPRPLPAAAPKPSLPSIHGGASVASASTLRLDLPAGLNPQDLEITVQVRQAGQVVAEGHLEKAAPSVGGISRLSLELKRG